MASSISSFWRWEDEGLYYEGEVEVRSREETADTEGHKLGSENCFTNGAA